MFDEPCSELRVIGWRLAANANRLANPLGGLNRLDDHLLHRRIPFIEEVRHGLRIPVEAERELRQIVRADGVAIEDGEEGIGQHDIRRQLAHGVDL